MWFDHRQVIGEQAGVLEGWCTCQPRTRQVPPAPSPLILDNSDACKLFPRLPQGDLASVSGEKSESESHSVVSDSLWPHGCGLPGSSVHGNSPGQNTGVGSCSLLQGIFPIQGSNPRLPHCGWILYHLSHKGSPRILEWVSIPSPGDLPNPRIQLGPSVLQVDSLPAELPGKLS